jgi:tetratricopeptide (TPR) repeat protein
MKRLTYSLAIVSLIALMSGCASLKKMQETAESIDYTVQPEVLEMHGGEVAVSITGKVPEKYFNAKATALITPVLVYEGGETALTPVSIQGEKVEGNNTAINFKEGGSFTYSDTKAYKSDMMRSHLEVRISATKGSKTVEFAPYTIAQGIVATPDLVMVNPKVVYAKDKFEKDVPATEMAAVNFDKNSSLLKYSEKRADDIKALKEFIAHVKEDERKRFDNVQIDAYASPEGTQELNTKLADKRAEVADKYIKREFKDMEDMDETTFFLENATPEDWAGFEKLVRESNLEEKDMILRVIQMHSDVNQREAEFRNMTKIFKELEAEIHPKLRRSEINVNITLIGHTDEEIKDLIANDIDSLKQEELLYAATLYDNKEKQLEIYTHYTEVYPEDWRGHNNVGAAQFELGNVEAAKTAFEKAKAAEANATVFNNMGAVELMNGNIEKAEQNLTSATGVKEASYNQGIIKIKQAEYSTAVSFFGEDCSFNAALANLMNGNFDAAIRLAECGDDKDAAMNYYIKAVAGARKGDTEIMFNNLRTACSKDAALKTQAANDVEFINYFEEQTFKNIVE